MAYMNRMVVLHMWAMRERRIFEARAQKKSNKAPREPIDAMRQRGKKMTVGASSRSYAAGEWMFEHREAVLTPLGGGTITH